MKPNIERLELIATMLDEVAAGTWKLSIPVPPAVVGKWKARYRYEADKDEVPTFDLVEWFYPVWENETFDLYEDENVCGYSACAIGHALLDSRFAELGLVPDRFGQPACLILGEDYKATGWRAVEHFFGIDYHTAETLFAAPRYPLEEKTDPAAVAHRVRSFIEQGNFLSEWE